LDATQLSHGIQLSIAPVFLLTAVAALIGALAPRLARVVDRARLVNDAIRERPEIADDEIREEMALLAKRMRLINWAMGLLVLCSILIATTIALLFLVDLGTVSTLRIIPIVFVTGLACFVAALIAFLREIQLASIGIRFWLRSP
jgi:Protein of unknown function (DUF2721)